MKRNNGLIWFTRQLRTVLASLYDPSVLRNSPLAKLLEADQQKQPIFALRRTITNAIEKQNPGMDVPPDSRSWRVYQILRRRYTEQVPQRELAADLGLSIRQLQREEKLAREILAEYLWVAHNLKPKVLEFTTTQPPVQMGNQAVLPEAQTFSRDQELESLKNSVKAQTSDIGDLIRDVLLTVDPLMTTSDISIEYSVQENLPSLFLKELLLRQALLNLVTTAIQSMQKGEVSIRATNLHQHLCIDIQATIATAPEEISSQETQERPEGLKMTEQLIDLCGGALEMALHLGGSETFTARITLPVKEYMVLFIEDNDDTRRLFQRYLSGSRYRFIGAASASRGVTLAKELNPQIIVLDIMMPESSGWIVLGQLREHPATQHVPIIVSSIVPQAELAYALGATAFIRKPFDRSALLSALDRQLALQQKESH